MGTHGEGEGEILTRNIPRFTLVEVDLDHEERVGAGHLLHQIIADQLVVFRVEPEPRWQLCLHHAYVAHVSVSLEREKRERERERLEKVN